MTSYQTHRVTREDTADGAVLLRSPDPLGDVVPSTGVWLRHWAEAAPERVFLAERSGAGWRTISFAETLDRVRALAAGLLDHGLTAETPVLIMSGNSVDHGVLSLAAQYVGIPVVPVAEQYALIPEAHNRLTEVIELVRPGLAFAADGNRFANALSLDVLQGIQIVSSTPGATKATPLDGLLRGASGVDAAHAAVGPDTIAKILMTSGSTSSPKGVITTHRMLCVNQAQVAVGMPFLREHPPCIVDWLPWNHTFGGSHNFNMMLANGGALYIDDGKPVNGLFDRTVENLGSIPSTMMFNVPVGYQMLVEALRGDPDLRTRIFQDLDMIFYSGAALSPQVWTDLEAMALEARGALPLMTSSWGMTETAPAMVLQQEPGGTSGRIGVPLPGAEVKLIPQDDHRFDVRVKGPNVTPGYFNAPEKTAEAFDENGFFVTGDAMSFVDPHDMAKGLRFEGRISDDFKLATGTWVRATALRAEILTCLAPLATDVVITGHELEEIGLLVIPNQEACAEAGFSDAAEGGVMMCPVMGSEVSKRLGVRSSTGSSTKIARVLVMADPPSLALGEVTAKGNLNKQKILATRGALVARLYDDADPAVIKI